jgi:enoyl-[acyl-carrier protein] reductase I
VTGSRMARVGRAGGAVPDGTAGPALLAGRCGLVVAVSSEESIGFHCAARLRDLGAQVAIAHRPARADVAERLRESCGAELAVPLDVRDEESVAAAFSEIERMWKRMDFLVHTVMHVPPSVLTSPLLELGREDFRAVVDDAAYSLVVLARRALPLLTRSDAGRIVTLSSSCAERYTPSYHVAGIAKAALESCALYLAAELGPSGILCNVLRPSLLATEGAKRTVGPGPVATTRAHLPKKAFTRRAVEYGDIADLVAFLCSSLCRSVTGEVLTADGGFAKNYF